VCTGSLGIGRLGLGGNLRDHHVLPEVILVTVLVTVLVTIATSNRGGPVTMRI